MKRFLLVVVTVAGLAGVGACNKPTAEECRAAILNMEKLLHTNIEVGRTSESEGEVRRCKGGSTQKAVTCAIRATTLAELKACDFMGKAKAEPVGKDPATPAGKDPATPAGKDPAGK